MEIWKCQACGHEHEVKPEQVKAESALMNLLSVLDLDLPLANRTQANLWKSKCFEYMKELSKANKGLRRLSKQNKRFRDAIRNIR